MAFGFLRPTEFDRKWAAWNRARKMIGADPAQYRQDDYGYMICWDSYGDRNCTWGWEIDHIHPTCLGGADDLSNLRALHCKVNASLGGMLSGILGK